MIKHTLRKIVKENELNKLIKDQKIRGSRELILFTSLWDEVSSNLVHILETSPLKKSVNIINSFDAPHSFVIWKLHKVPSLVVLDGRGHDKRVVVTNHITDIYKRLGLDR